MYQSSNLYIVKTDLYVTPMFVKILELNVTFCEHSGVMKEKFYIMFETTIKMWSLTYTV